MNFWNFFTAGERGVNKGNEEIDNGKGILHGMGSFFGFFGGTTDSPILKPTQAMDISDVFAAVSLIAQRVAATPFNVQELEVRNNRTFRKVNETHWAHLLINERPNPFQTSTAFMETIIVSALLSDGALIYKAKDRTGKVIELWPMPIGSWEQQRLTDGGVQYRVVITKADGTTTKPVIYKADDVILIHGVGMDAYSGVSPIQAARSVLGVHKSLAAAQKAFADNVGMPRGIVSTEHAISDEAERDALLEAVVEKFEAGASGIMLLDGKTTFTSLADTMVNSQFIQQNELNTKRIAAAFHVPASILLGNPVTDVELDAFSQDGIRPWLIRIEKALNRFLLGNDPRFKFRADEFKHLRGDPIKQIDYVTKALGSGGSPAVMTQNEAREFLGYNPLDDDVYDQISLGGYSETTGLAEGGKPQVKPKPDSEGDNNNK